MKTLGDFSCFNARRSPDKIAVRLGDDCLTYGKMDADANALAQAMAAQGVGPGDRISVLAQNSLAYAVLTQATARAGAIFAPLNVRLLGAELARVIAHCEPALLFVESAYLTAAREAVAGLARPPKFILMDGAAASGELPHYEQWRTSYPATPLGREVDPQSAAAILYSSGTTGAPKGIVLSHEKYLRILHGIIVDMDLNERDIAQCAMPLFHNGGLASVLFPALMVGATVVLHRGSFDPAAVLADIAKYRVTMTHWVPTMLGMIVEQMPDAGIDVSTLTKIHYGSSPIAPEKLVLARQLFKAGFYQGYGTTDCGLIACLRPEHHEDRAHMTGRPVYNTFSRIVDGEGRDVAEGEVGEVIVDGRFSGMSGYWRDPETTAKTIRDGWIYSGDLARREADGFFTLVGRSSAVINSGAEKILPVEVENVLCDCPGILEVAVVGAPDAKFGEVVCAVIAAQPGVTVSLESVRAFCDGRLARYKIPRRVVVVDGLPRTAIGKVATGSLREMVAKTATAG